MNSRCPVGGAVVPAVFGLAVGRVNAVRDARFGNITARCLAKGFSCPEAQHTIRGPVSGLDRDPISFRRRRSVTVRGADVPSQVSLLRRRSKTIRPTCAHTAVVDRAGAGGADFPVWHRL